MAPTDILVPSPPRLLPSPFTSSPHLAHGTSAMTLRFAEGLSPFAFAAFVLEGALPLRGGGEGESVSASLSDASCASISSSDSDSGHSITPPATSAPSSVHQEIYR